MTSVVVAGDVGGPDWYHVGDEAMLAANLAMLRRCRPDVEVTVISRDPAWTADHYGVSAVLPLGRAGAEVNRALERADALVLSGGGNLCSRWPEHIRDRATLIETTHRLGKPVVILGQTIGPDLEPDDRDRLARALSQACIVGLRGAFSVALARSLGIDRARIVEQLDDAWFLSPIPSAAVAQEPAHHRRPWIAVTLAPLAGDPAEFLPVLRSFGRQLSEVARAIDADLVFIPHWNALAGTESDALLARRLFGFLDVPERATLRPVESGEDTCWLTRQASLVISSRYHPLVFGLSGAVPAVGIHQGEHTRVRQAECLGHAGLEAHAVSFAAAVDGGLAQAALHAWIERDAIARRLAERAEAWRERESGRWARVAQALGWSGVPGPAVDSAPAPLEVSVPHAPALASTRGRPAGAIDVSAVVLTRTGSSRLEHCLRSIVEAGVASELVVLVDETSTDDSEAVARRFTSRVRRLRTRGYIEPSLPEMVAACSGEFVLRIDDDEALGGDWAAPFAEAGDLTRLTHVLVPRRWLVPGLDSFISSDDWFPDLQLRFFRNDPALIHWPSDLHEHLTVDGPGLVLWDRWIDHHVLWQLSRAEREAKCAAYRQTRPGKHLSHFYLWEEQAVRLTRCGPHGASAAEPLASGADLSFTTTGGAGPYLLDGWSHAEQWGTWTDGPVALLRLPLTRPPNGLVEIIVDAIAFVRPEHPELGVTVSCGSVEVATWRIDTPGDAERTIVIPAELAAGRGVLDLSFAIDRPVSPAELGLSSDGRRLGLGLRRLRLDPGNRL